MDESCPWHQVNVAFPDWASAEHTAVDHLGPLLNAAEDEGFLTAWFFVRKAPCWRLRYLPSAHASAARARLDRGIDDLRNRGLVTDVTEFVYEPETRAFGGAEAMDSAHRLFHLDSRHLLAHFARTRHTPGPGHRRELSILLCTILMRAAGLDWYEQGDVWARVAEHREPFEQLPPDKRHTLRADVRRLMSVDTTHLADEDSPLGLTTTWTDAFASAGRELAASAAGGRLHRGVRAVLTHHVVFAWNRLGLAYATQATLADAAQAVVFGPDPTKDPHAKGDRTWPTPTHRRPWNSRTNGSH